MSIMITKSVRLAQKLILCQFSKLDIESQYSVTILPWDKLKTRDTLYEDTKNIT